MIAGLLIALGLLVFVLVLLCVELDAVRRRVDWLEDRPEPTPFDWDDR